MKTPYKILIYQNLFKNFYYIFMKNKLDRNSVIEEFSATAYDGKKYEMKFYNLDAIISVGYQINSIRATQFRRLDNKN